MAASSAPKTQETEAQPSLTDISFAILQLAEAIKSGQSSPAQANPQLDAMLALIKEREDARPHENLFNPPMMSDYNPQGDRDNPKPDLKCKMYWLGYKMTKETMTPEEVSLMNRLEPGNYRVVKSDGRSIPFTVQTKLDEAGKLEKLNVTFPCKNTEDRMNHLSMSAYLRSVLGEKTDVELLYAKIDDLKLQLAQRA